MTPLITKFAKEQSVSWDEKLCGVEYNTELESLVILGSGRRVIDDKNAQVELTGSLTTQAQFDATRDEPTDR
jgi:hypothetical protein